MDTPVNILTQKDKNNNNNKNYFPIKQIMMSCYFVVPTILPTL